jgi:hypothetical protein
MTAFDILLGLTWMASYRPPADESPSVPERAKFGNTPNEELLTDPTQRPHHLCLTFAPPVSARRFDPRRAPRRNTAAALARKALPAAVPDRRPADRTLRSSLQNIRAKLPAIGKQRHVRICQHLNLAHQSIASTALEIMNAIIVTLKSKAIRRRVWRPIRPRLHRSGGIRE